MKIAEKVLETKLRVQLKIGNCQNGFVSGQSHIDAICMMRPVQKNT